MVLSPGMHVGPYEVAAPLGAGGMGEVYRAHDSRLGREVAIKVLRTDGTDVPDRSRLEAEARASSRLNHPNIVTIYDIGEESGTPYIVSELLEGDSLRALIEPGGMPVRKLLDIAVQIADGLAAAHAAHLVHRDLKPENVMVLRDGRVKILDFGLAKPEATSNDEKTRTAIRLGGSGGGGAATAPGMIVGTLAYMSPEQAQGTQVDAQSDQFSFGSILYEMATGQRPFQRGDRVSTLSAIVKEEPAPISSVNALVPAPLRWVVDRCLAKEPARRYTSTADLHHQLRDIRDHLSEVVSTEVSAQQVAHGIRWRRVLALPALLLVAGAGFTAALMLHWHDRGISAYRFTPFATDAMDEAEPAWSPDGRSLAYVGALGGVPRIFVRNQDSPEPAQISPSDVPCHQPFWSHDGARVYYWSRGSLWSVSAAGGTPQEVLQQVTYATPPAAISPDGVTVAFFRENGNMRSLYLMSLADGKLSPYKRAPFPETFRLVGGLAFSPNGRKLFASIVPAVDDKSSAQAWIIPLGGGDPRLIPAPLPRSFRAISASWTPDNQHLVFAAELTPGERGHLYSLDSGTGAIERITTSTSEEREPTVSSDGKRIAFVNGGPDYDLMELSADGTRVTPLVVTSRHERSGDWSPSGLQFAYVSDASGVPEVWLRGPGDNSARPIVRGTADGYLEYAAPRFSPDGKRLAYVRVGVKHMVWISNLTGGQAVLLEQESTDQHTPAWSPDGTWVAYARFGPAGWEIAKAPAGGGGKPIPVAKGGGPLTSIEWSRSGEWICFIDTGTLYVAPASGGTPQRVASEIAAFTLNTDGKTATAMARAQDRTWRMRVISIPDGAELRSTPVAISPDVYIPELRPHPDGHFVITAVNFRRDIWILEGFSRAGLAGFFGTTRPLPAFPKETQ